MSLNDHEPDHPEGSKPPGPGETNGGQNGADGFLVVQPIHLTPELKARVLAEHTTEEILAILEEMRAGDALELLHPAFLMSS